ncbi:MAG: hypothetical protein GX493_09865, partial [Firmicutes bacterium]|nr:hypothetical protein [Bacillota bacterium]
MDRKGMQVIKDVASKTAGLVFFSLLAIALGVVFTYQGDGDLASIGMAEIVHA